MKRSKIRAKRPGPPRRGRVVDLKYLTFMASLNECAVFHFSTRGYECSGRNTTHHVREWGSPKDDRKTIRLCEGHHLHDFSMFSIERLGKVEFEQRTGLSIQALIVYYNEAYESQQA